MWWWPQYLLRDGDTLDPDDPNEVFASLWGFLSAIGEHNLNANALGPPDFAVTPDRAIVRVFQFRRPDPTVHEGAGTSGTTYWVPRDGIWHVVGDDGTPWVLAVGDVPAGDLEVTVTAQVTFDPALGLADWGPDFQIGIELDGALIPETVTGTLDPENDLETSNATTASSVATLAVNDAGAARINRILPAVLHAVVPVSAGDHTVRLLARAREAVPNASIADLTVKFGAVKNGEITAIWMK